MSEEPNYKHNPLHGMSLKAVVIELVDHYGFEILYAYLTINCFKTNPSIESSIKFLKKTSWACEKVEAFYLYQFKNLPRATDEQFELPPRDRIVPDEAQPKEPAKLSLEDAKRLREKRQRKSSNRGAGNRHNTGSSTAKKTSRQSSSNTKNGEIPPSTDPWAKWR